MLHRLRSLAACGLFVLMALAVLVMQPVIAFAQSATAPSLLDRPMVGLVVEMAIVVFGPIVGGLASLILLRLYALVGLKQTAENRATIEQVLERAAAYARAKFNVPSGDIPKAVREGVYQMAANYALESGPKALGREGIKDTGSDRLRRMLDVRLANPGFAVLSADLVHSD